MAADLVPYWVVGKHKIPKYTVVILFCLTALFVGYTHRNVVSVTKHDVSKENGWDRTMEAQYIASYYYGYIILQLVIGYLCLKFGGKWVLGGGLLMSSVFTLIAPSVSSDFVWLILDRIITGVFQGAAIPGTTALYAAWIPQNFYSIATGLQYSGMYLGTAIANGLGPTLTTKYGWASNFYVYGIVGLVWFAAFAFFVQSAPNPADPNIEYVGHGELPMVKNNIVHDSKASFDHRHGDHRELIDHDITHVHNDTDTDHDLHRKKVSELTLLEIFAFYGVFLKTPRCLVLYTCHFCSNWSMYLLMGYAPTYLKTVLGLAPDMQGLFGFLPYLLIWVFLMASSVTADYVIKNKILSRTMVRKILVGIGFLGPVLFMGLLTQAGSQTEGSAYFVLSIILSGAAIPGFFPMALEIGGDVGGLVIAVSNTIATIPGIVAPLVTGSILRTGNCTDTFPEADSCKSAWKTVFYISIGIYCFGTIICVLFANAETLDFYKLNPLLIKKERKISSEKK